MIVGPKNKSRLLWKIESPKLALTLAVQTILFTDIHIETKIRNKHTVNKHNEILQMCKEEAQLQEQNNKSLQTMVTSMRVQMDGMSNVIKELEKHRT